MRLFQRTALGRGRQYFSSGRAGDPVWSGQSVDVVVRGAGGDYNVHFDFSQVAEKNILPAKCDCPAFERGAICKHLWTGILQVEKASPAGLIPESGLLKLVREKSSGDGNQRRPPRPQGSHRTSVPPLAKHETGTWIERLNNLQGISTQGNAWASANLSSSFVIQGADTLSSGKLVLDLWTRSRSNTGALGPLRPNRVSGQGIAEYFDTTDQETLSTLLKTSLPASNSRSRNPATRFVVDSVLEGHLIPLLAGNGKLFLSRSPNGSPDSAERPLRMDRGANWDLEMRLESYDSTHYRLGGQLTRPGETRALNLPVAILKGGFVLFEETIGKFSNPKHATWAFGLRNSDFLVPKAQGDQLLTRVLLDPNAPKITWPESMGWATETIEPKPIGVFRPLANDPSIGRMTLTVSFDYAGREVALSETESSFVNIEEKKVLKRNHQFEEKILLDALRILRDPQGTGSVPTSDLNRAADELMRAGWTIFIDKTKVRVPHDFSMNVSSGADWFDLSMDLDFGDLSVTREDLLLALKAQNGLVKLSDGTMGMLPQEWSDQYASLSQLGEVTEDGNFRFNKSQGLLLNSLLTESEHLKVDDGFQSFREKIGKFEGVKTAKAPTGFKGELRNYQKEGLTWLRFLEEFETGGILADDMGLGKTIQILAFLLGRTKKKSKTKKPHLVVTPKSLAFNWIDEAGKFAPALKIVRYSGSGREQILEDLENIDVLVTTYGTLRADVEKLREIPFDVSIIDEAQAIKNPKSQAAMACKELRAELKIALTGTPIENSINDLLSILEFTNPGLVKFKEASPEALAQLGKLLKPFMLRRTKEKVLTELPDKSEQVLYCEMGAEEREFYNSIRDQYRASLADKVKKVGLGRSKLHVLEALLRLRQAACHSGLIDPSRASEPSAKLQQLLRHMQEVIQEGHKVLVFSQFTSLLALVRTRLEDEGIKYEYLDGQTEDRKTPVDRFQSDPECPAFLISLKAGGTGLNLTAADYVFILDPWWNPAVEAQAIGRAHRMGQTNKVIAYRMIAKGSVEEKILDLQKTKKELAESIVSEDQDFMKKLTKEDLEMLLD